MELGNSPTSFELCLPLFDCLYKPHVLTYNMYVTIISLHLYKLLNSYLLEDKVPYEKLAATDKERYNREMEVYNASLKVDDVKSSSSTKKKKQKKTSPKKKKQQSKKEAGYNHVGSIEHAYNLPPSPQKMKEAAAAKNNKLNSSIAKKVVGDKVPSIMPQREYFLKLSREKKQQQKLVVGDGSGLKDKKASPFLLDANVAKGLSEIFKAGELDEPPAPSLADNDTPNKGSSVDNKQKENHANTAAGGDDDSSTASSDSILNEEKGLQSSRKLDYDDLELDNATEKKAGVKMEIEGHEDSNMKIKGGDEKQLDRSASTATAVANNLDVDGKMNGIDSAAVQSGKATQVTAKKDKETKHLPREVVATLEPSSTTSATVSNMKQNRVSIEPGDLPSTPSKIKPSASVQNTWTLNLRPMSKEDTDSLFTEKKITYEEPDYLLPGGREYCVERKVIEKSVSDTNHQAKVVLGRNRNTGIEWGAVSRALCEVCLTSQSFGSPSDEVYSVSSKLQLTMKKPAQEHAVHLNGRRVDSKVGVTTELKDGDILSLYGPLGFAYRVQYERMI